LIIPQELHDKLIKQKVNDVNQRGIGRKVFLGKSKTIIKDFIVLRERSQLSFKTTVSPQLILLHIPRILL